jgi:manganese transport protein
LEDVHRSVPVPGPAEGFWKNWWAYTGPALLVSVGYMDPGNWGTALEAGATYKYGLLWVVALASLMAIFIQVIAARLGVVTGKDLAQACRDYYPRWTRWPNWLACEVAIGACDLAEVLGSAVALKLLFHLPLLLAVLITAFDVMVLLALQRFGIRKIEAFILVLVATIGTCYFIEIFVLSATRPDFAEMGRALIRPGLGDTAMLAVAIGIIGATVMPHNLYLHSALVQTRKFQADDRSILRAIKYNTLDSVIALSLAFLVNAAILVMAATTFFGREDLTFPDGRPIGSDWIQGAYLTLAPLLGTSLASTLFAVALLASGQSSTVTGTLAGQVVMEGFMHWRIQPWLRRLVTRLLAIVPAVVVIAVRGENSVTELLVLSQIVLGLQLPLALVPLLQFTSSRRRMGKFVNPIWLKLVGWACTAVITALDVYLLLKTMLGD